MTEWRYLPRGTVTHALSDPSLAVAACGACVVTSADWRGTGSQVEYETARDMARCKRCAKKLGIPTDHEHPCPAECIPGVECCICDRRRSES